MYKLSKEILLMSEIAACISMDKFVLLNKKISRYKKQNFDPVKLYEVLLQTYLFCGFPATIESLNIFKNYYPDFRSYKAEYDIVQFKSSGISNCKLIYKKNYKKLIDNITGLSADLKEWMLVEGYGKVLGRAGLVIEVRELINVTMLCTHYYESQLHSHIKGCLNLNITKNDVKTVVNNLDTIAAKINIGKAIQLIDKIYNQQ